MKLSIKINGDIAFETDIREGDEFVFGLYNGSTGKTSFNESLMVEFDKARSIYPGKKRGLPTEFMNFRKKTKDWKDALPLLYSAIIAQDNEKKRLKYSGRFCPEWPNFQTWINQRRWEEEIELPKQVQGPSYAIRTL